MSVTSALSFQLSAFSTGGYWAMGFALGFRLWNKVPQWLRRVWFISLVPLGLLTVVMGAGHGCGGLHGARMVDTASNWRPLPPLVYIQPDAKGIAPTPALPPVRRRTSGIRRRRQARDSATANPIAIAVHQSLLPSSSDTIIHSHHRRTQPRSDRQSNTASCPRASSEPERCANVRTPSLRTLDESLMVGSPHGTSRTYLRRRWCMACWFSTAPAKSSPTERTRRSLNSARCIPVCCRSAY